MKRRVVITGVGPITPIGIGKDEFWGNLIAGKSGIGFITQFDASDPGFTTKIAGEVKDFDFANYGDKKEGKRMDRVTQFAVAAAKLAVEDAELDLEKIDPVRAGVCVGSGIGGLPRAVFKIWRKRSRQNQSVLHSDGDPEYACRPDFYCFRL